MATQIGSIAVFDEAEIRSKLALNQSVVDCIAKAFELYSSGECCVPPVMQINVADVDGQTCVKSAAAPGLSGFAVKVSSNFPGNPSLGVPANSGLFILCDAVTGAVQSVFLDNGYLTQLRTAAAGAVAADLLARKDATRLCVLGTGLQARMQAHAVALVRKVSHISVWGRSGEKARALAATLHEELGVECDAATNPQVGVSAADIVVCTTPAKTPIIQSDWIRPGQHITAMGSDAPAKNELDPDILRTADLVCCDSVEQCSLLGELQHAKVLNSPERKISLAELGNVVSGKHPGRTSPQEVTVADLTGVGTQDTQIALLAQAMLATDRSRQHQSTHVSATTRTL